MTSQESQHASQNNFDDTTNFQTAAASGSTVNNTVNIYSPNKEKPTPRFCKCILLLSANPQNPEGRARSKESLSEIEKVLNKATLRRAKKRETPPELAFICDELRTRGDELSHLLPDIEPYIIDISGVEDGVANLFLGEDFQLNKGRNPDFLIGETLRIGSPSTKCTILNGCYLEGQAREIVQHVDYLVGIDQSISIDAMLLFLNDFYYHVGLGIPVERAYEAGRNRVLKRGLDDTQVPILLTKTEELSRRQRERELHDLAQKIAEVPESVELRTRKGDLLEESGNHKRAASAYGEALHINDRNYKVWWRYGVAQANAGEYVKAKEAYDNALSLNPSLSDEYVILREYGSLLKSVKELKNSIASYKKSLWLQPRYRVANYEKRKTYKKLYFRSGN